MTSIPNWILNDLHKKKYFSIISDQQQNFLSKFSPKLLQHSKIYKNFPNATKKSSKITLKKANVKLEPLDFQNKCNNLWNKIENRISPVLSKCETITPAVKKTSMSPQLKKIRFNGMKKVKIYKHLRRFSNAIQYTDSTDEEYSNLGIQCDLNSEDSENAMQIAEENYLNELEV